MEYSKLKFKQASNCDEYYAFIYYNNVKAPKGEKKEMLISIDGIDRIEGKYITPKKKLKESLTNYEYVMEKIKEKKDRVEQIVSDYYKVHKKKPLCSYVHTALQKPIIKEKKKLESLTDYFDCFIIKKSGGFGEDSKAINIYYNNLDCFEQFEQKKKDGEKLNFADLETYEFWDEFIYFLAHEKEDTNRVKMKRYGLNNNTLLKRLKTTLEFIRWCVGEHEIKLNYFKITEFIKQVKQKNNVKAYEVSKFALTLDELQYFNIFTPSEYEKEKDMMLFMCLQGTRISDTISLTNDDIVKKQGVYYIQRDAIKTNEQFTVELHPVSKEIWEKWDCSFDMYEQDFNNRIKIVMKEFYLWYKEKYEERFDTTYELKEQKIVKKGKDIEKKKVNKWEMISSHYGRSTYISILCDNNKLTLKEIGTRTGQKDIRTTNGYVRSVSTHSAEELIPLTKLKIA